MSKGETWLNAGIGAVVTLALTFTGFSPLLGGAVAGYLQHDYPAAGAKVGALSGVLALVPLFVLFGFFTLLFGALWPMHAAMSGLSIIGIVFMWGLMVPMALLWFGGLGAVGGYLGAYLNVGPAQAE